MTVVPEVLSIQEFLLGLDAGLTAEIERHKDRTMTVASLSGEETITRCGTCPKEDTRPCTATDLGTPVCAAPGLPVIAAVNGIAIGGERLLEHLQCRGREAHHAPACEARTGPR
jgi:hypothetical protein